MKKEVPASPIGGGDGPRGKMKDDLALLDDLFWEPMRDVQKIESILKDIVIRAEAISIATQLQIKAIIHKGIDPYLKELRNDPTAPVPSSVLDSLKEIDYIVG